MPTYLKAPPPLDAPIPELIGWNIAKRRTEMGVTQDMLSQRVGLGVNTLIRLESGQANPRLKTILTLAAYLHLTWADLVARPLFVWEKQLSKDG